MLYDRGGWHGVAVRGGWPTGLANFPRGGLDVGEMALLNRFLTPGSILFASVAHPAEYQELLGKAVAAPDFETHQALVWEMQKVETDEYAMIYWHHVIKGIAARHLQIHDDGFSTASGPGQWTPEDAWIEQRCKLIAQ